MIDTTTSMRRVDMVAAKRKSRRRQPTPTEQKLFQPAQAESSVRPTSQPVSTIGVPARTSDYRRADRHAKKGSSAGVTALGIVRNAAATFSTILCVIAIAFLVMLVMGVKFYVITGGSMTGTIDKGSLCMDRTVPVESLKVGDIVTFTGPGTTRNVTHRIISRTKVDGQLVFQTQGDANKAADPWKISFVKSVQARYWFHIPYVGYAFAFLSIPLVRGIMFAAFAMFVIGVIFSFMAPRKKPARRRIESRDYARG